MESARLQEPALDVRSFVASDGVAVLAASGECETGSAARLETALRNALGDGVTHVYLDLSELSFLDSSGIRALLHVQRAMDAAGCHFAVVAPMGHVRKALRIAGVESMLDIRETVDTTGPTTY